MLVALGLVKKEEKEGIDFSRMSSWLRLRRMVAWVIRFVHNCQVSTEKDRMKGTFVPEDLEAAEELILKDVQREAFDKEMRTLRASETLPTTNKLASLSPLLTRSSVLVAG